MLSVGTCIGDVTRKAQATSRGYGSLVGYFHLLDKFERKVGNAFSIPPKESILGRFPVTSSVMLKTNKWCIPCS